MRLNPQSCPAHPSCGGYMMVWGECQFINNNYGNPWLESITFLARFAYSFVDFKIEKINLSRRKVILSSLSKFPYFSTGARGTGFFVEPTFLNFDFHTKYLHFLYCQLNSRMYYFIFTTTLLFLTFCLQIYSQ